MGQTGVKSCCISGPCSVPNTDLKVEDESKQAISAIPTKKQLEEAPPIINQLTLTSDQVTQIDKFTLNKKNQSPIQVIALQNKESVIQDYDMTKFIKLSQAAEKAPILELKVINSSVLPKGTILQINPLGLKNSQREANDGYVYFGSNLRLQDDTNQQDNIVNDFALISNDVDADNKHLGRHFQITYDVDQDKYKIKDLGIGYGVFSKLIQPQIIIDNLLINMGYIFMVCNVIKDDKDENLLRVKFFGGPCNGETYDIDPVTKEICIGRSKECSICIQDSMLSKYQCTIQYNELTKTWYLIDGHKDKASTNGTWYYLAEEKYISHEMYFKANQTVFQALLIPQS